MIASWERFLIAVDQMRECQKVYFRTRQPNALHAAKKCEAQVDNFIKQKRADRVRELQQKFF